MSLDSILLIEDDKINALTFKKGLSRVNNEIELIILETAENALQYLRNGNNKPCIIVLDLNLPKMNGIEFLSIVKKDNSLKGIPVIVLTTSINPQDKINCYNLQVAGYFVKPLDYFELIESVFNYWRKSEFVHPVKKEKSQPQ
ncbi:MAG TPA: response regulator [Bacteroidia bacterium]|jgi:CheY-like chemotaxis protein|nr:response regulator [Bacteroidia bacterium]